MVAARLLGTLLLLGAAPPVHAQARTWLPEDRSLVTTFADAAALAVGRDRLYIASDAGIAVRAILQQRWLPPLAPVSGYPPAGLASALAYDAVSDGLWLGLDNGELYQLSFAFGEWRPAGFVADAPIIRIRPDPAEGVLWVGTPAGWYRVRDDGSFGRFMTRAEMVPEEVRRAGEQNLPLLAVQGTLGLDTRLRRFALTDAVPAGQPGIYFVGTAGGGVVRIDTNTLDRAWELFGTLSRGVGSVAVAGDRIWFGGDGQGPRNGVAWSTRDLSTWMQIEAGVDGAPRGFVAHIVAGADAVWFAASDGVYRLRGDWRHFTSADGLPADQATAIEDSPGGTWVATLRGLARIDAGDRVGRTVLAATRVLDLARSADTLWIATERGLFRMAGAAGAPEAIDGIPAGPVVAVSATDGLVAAITPDALFTRRAGAWSPPDRSAAAAGLGRLLRLLIADDGSFWVAGEGGVARVDAGGVRQTWRVPDDIVAGPVRGLALDGDDLWVATPAGALRIDRTR